MSWATFVQLMFLFALGGVVCWAAYSQGRRSRRWIEAKAALPSAGVDRSDEMVEVKLPIDPEDLPSWKIYRPRPDSPPRSCLCHPQQSLVDGQPVLWWPVPGSRGAVNVYCKDGVEVPEK